MTAQIAPLIEDAPRPRRGRIGLTPMVDVVFLLLVFFMLVTTVGDEARIVPLGVSGPEEEETAASPAYTGAPRLVTVTPEAVRLNGMAVETTALVEAVRPLMPSPEAVVIVRPAAGATLQRTVDVLDALRLGGIGVVVLVP